MMFDLDNSSGVVKKSKSFTQVLRIRNIINPKYRFQYIGLQKLVIDFPTVDNESAIGLLN